MRSQVPLLCNIYPASRYLPIRTTLQITTISIIIYHVGRRTNSAKHNLPSAACTATPLYLSTIIACEPLILRSRSFIRNQH